MRRISQVSRLRETSIFSHTLIAEAWLAVIVLVDSSRFRIEICPVQDCFQDEFSTFIRRLL